MSKKLILLSVTTTLGIGILCYLSLNKGCIASDFLTTPPYMKTSYALTTDIACRKAVTACQYVSSEPKRCKIVSK